MSVLSSKTIQAMVFDLVNMDKSEDVTVEELLRQVNPASLDLTISRQYLRAKRNDSMVTYGFKHDREAAAYSGDTYWQRCNAKSGYILLQPGDAVLASTREYIVMPDNLCAQLFTKSTLGRMFINHMMAGFIDPGFQGRLTLELKNEGTHVVKIPVGARVVQMIFSKLDKKGYAYNGRYNEAMGAEAAKQAVQ